MPILESISDENENFSIMIWKYHANDDFTHLKKYEAEFNEKINASNLKKQLEYWMIRALLYQKLPDEFIIYKENKPYLSLENFHISISHSFPFAALGISKEKIGIDLEPKSDRYQKIKDKILHPNETVWLPKNKEISYLNMIWVLKEALYKISALKAWSFRENYEISAFDNELETIHCRVFSEHTSETYSGKIYNRDDFYLGVVH